jgi:hypothetical protein
MGLRSVSASSAGSTAEGAPDGEDFDHMVEAVASTLLSFPSSIPATALLSRRSSSSSDSNGDLAAHERTEAASASDASTTTGDRDNKEQSLLPPVITATGLH